MKFFTQSHLWVDIEHQIATVGISDFARNAIGEVEYLEIAPVGTCVSAGLSIGTLETAKLVIEIISPVTGVITNVNSSYGKKKSSVSSIEASNWICMIQTLSPKVVYLMSEHEYHEFTSKNN